MEYSSKNMYDNNCTICDDYKLLSLVAINILNSWKLILPSPSRSASSIMERTSASVTGSPRLFIVSLDTGNIVTIVTCYPVSSFITALKTKDGSEVLPQSHDGPVALSLAA